MNINQSFITNRPIKKISIRLLIVSVLRVKISNRGYNIDTQGSTTRTKTNNVEMVT